MHSQPQDLTRTLLAVLSIGLLIVASMWILRPFLLALIWATMIVVASWPIMLRLQGWLGGKRSLAVLAMTLALLLIFVVPFTAMISIVIGHADQVMGWTKNSFNNLSLAPPQWLVDLPLIGGKLSDLWLDVAGNGPGALASKLSPYVGTVMGWFFAKIGSLGMLIVQFLLTVILSAILFWDGESALAGVKRFAHRLAGENGDQAVRLAGQAIRGVALGVVATALIQSTVGGMGLAAAGVPFAATLTVIMFVLALAQIGAGPVMVCGVIWLYHSGDTGWGSALLVWTIIVGSMDNVIRPILIKKGADLSLLLIFSGVIGGLLTFGMVGIFVGPVVLAVSFALLEAWVKQGSAQAQNQEG